MKNTDLSRYSCRAEAYEASEDTPSNRSEAPTIGDVINRRFGRRDVLKGALGVAAMGAIAGTGLAAMGGKKALAASASFNFSEISHGVDETHHVAPGYSAEVLIRWGDPVLPDAPAFDPMNQTAAAQATQFGYNIFLNAILRGQHNRHCIASLYVFTFKIVLFGKSFSGRK